jgi:amino acid transporter
LILVAASLIGFFIYRRSDKFATNPHLPALAKKALRLNFSACIALFLYNSVIYLSYVAGFRLRITSFDRISEMKWLILILLLLAIGSYSLLSLEPDDKQRRDHS